jgi:hypothetical protein
MVYTIRNNAIEVTKILPYLISAECLNGFMKYVESTIYGTMQTRFYYGSVWL